MTDHETLVQRAAAWLRNTRRCKLVIVNAKPWSANEHPDVIGWLPTGESIVVECKVSHGDLLADHRKRWRTMSVGMGMYRFTMVPPVLEVKWNPDWFGGVLVVEGRRVRVARECPPRQTRDWPKELCMLLARIDQMPQETSNAD